MLRILQHPATSSFGEFDLVPSFFAACNTLAAGGVVASVREQCAEFLLQDCKADSKLRIWGS